MIPPPFSLRYLVPATLLCGAVIVAGASLSRQFTRVDRDVESSAASQARMLAELVAGELEEAHRNSGALHARASLLRASADRSLSAAALFGEDDHVLYATKLTSIGQAVDQTTFASITHLFEAARSGLGSRTEVSSDGEVLFTLHPVLVRREKADLLPSEVGVLALRHDLRDAKASRRHTAVFEALSNLLPVGGVGLVLAAVFHVYLTRRAQALVRSTQQIARGEYDVPILPGGDELAILSQSIAAMSREIEQQRAREQLMVTELDHRVKNSLSMILSLAHETRAVSTSLESFSVAFEGRLRSLAVAHEALAASRWEAVRLSDLAIRTLRPLAPDTDRIRFDGPSVDLPSETAAPLALSLHELGTNAIKHGAFSRPRGVVQMTWSHRGDGEVGIGWIESGGPKVVPPESPGLGTQLLRGLVEQELGGAVVMEYCPEGLRCHLTLPRSA